MTVSKRKSEHVAIASSREVRFRRKTTGFEAFDFIHCALPELNPEDVSTETHFMGKTLSFPLMISPMTGGYDGALRINRQLSEICEAERIALAVGSQRQITENDRHVDTFRIVRKRAPRTVVIGNIGAVQLIGIKDLSPIHRMVDLIEADAMAVHLNPLQELLQPEGKAHFRGVLKGIERLVAGIGVPVVVKEIGCGISEPVARRLVAAGVPWVDVAGAGGTSWAGIESYRGHRAALAHRFWDWGIPTAECIQAVRRVPGLRVIASGGIEDGVTMAKALALGAELCGSAQPLLKRLLVYKKQGLARLLQAWREELKTVLFLTGCRNVGALRSKPVLRNPGSVVSP